jgi:hypothetical protein
MLERLIKCKKTKNVKFLKMFNRPKLTEILFVRRNDDEMGRLLYYGSRIKLYFFVWGLTLKIIPFYSAAVIYDKFDSVLCNLNDVRYCRIPFDTA